MPIAPTFEDNTDLTIAVNLGGPPSGTPPPLPQAETKDMDHSLVDSVHTKISNFIDEIKSQVSLTDAGDWTMLRIADQTFDAMQGAIARQKLAAYPPDRTIMIARDACGTLEFDRDNEMIALGYETTAWILGKA